MSILRLGSTPSIELLTLAFNIESNNKKLKIITHLCIRDDKYPENSQSKNSGNKTANDDQKQVSLVK